MTKEEKLLQRIDNAIAKYKACMRILNTAIGSGASAELAKLALVNNAVIFVDRCATSSDMQSLLRATTGHRVKIDTVALSNVHSTADKTLRARQVYVDNSTMFAMLSDFMSILVAVRDTKFGDVALAFNVRYRMISDKLQYTFSELLRYKNIALRNSIAIEYYKLTFVKRLMLKLRGIKNVEDWVEYNLDLAEQA